LYIFGCMGLFSPTETYFQAKWDAESVFIE